MTDSTNIPPCHAGRSAFFGGAWTEPCSQPGRHAIGSPSAEPIRLCDEHFRQVNDAGLVTEPNIAEDEYERREARRVGAMPSPTVTVAPTKRPRWFKL